MRTKHYTWHKVSEAEAALAWNENAMAVVHVENKEIGIARHEGLLYGFALKCPHAGGPLNEGYIDPLGNVVCPLHRYKFNIKNGRNSSGEGYHLKTYPVESRTDGIFVGIEDKSLFGWF